MRMKFCLTCNQTHGCPPRMSWSYLCASWKEGITKVSNQRRIFLEWAMCSSSWGRIEQGPNALNSSSPTLWWYHKTLCQCLSVSIHWASIPKKISISTLPIKRKKTQPSFKVNYTVIVFVILDPTSWVLD